MMYFCDIHDTFHGQFIVLGKIHQRFCVSQNQRNMGHNSLHDNGTVIESSSNRAFV